jgi:hypothetical protein
MIDEPAFPGPRSPAVAIYRGMTIRDYFAAEAMIALLAMARAASMREIAEKSYAMADEMMEARKAPYR